MEDVIRQIVTGIQQGKTYETTLGNYAAGTRTKIEIKQDADNQGFIVTEIEQDGYTSAEWTETKNLANVDELTVYLKKIINH